MEAKGCAKPAHWKTARRFFYWAVRARLARTAAFQALSEASPGSTFEYRTRLLGNLTGIQHPADYKEEAGAIEKLDLTATVAQLKADYLARRLVELTKEDRKAALDGFLRFADGLSDDERAAVINVLQSASRSPGMYISILL
jgi:acetyl-CoA carboxylase/biotin carboxylase 1